MKRFWDAIRGMKLEGPRVALALLPLCLFGLQYLLLALIGEPEFRPAIAGFAMCYFMAFFALASGWFWARWFATGIGWAGAVLWLIALVTLPVDPDLPPELITQLRVIFGICCGLHALVVVMLMGKKMAARYELQPEWRQHFGMDEYGVTRLGRAVTRASAALPGLIFMALAPRQPADALLFGAVGLSLAGLIALVRLRTWGILALAAAGAMVLVASPHLLSVPVLPGVGGLGGTDLQIASPGLPLAMAVVLLSAALPFVGGAVRYYRSLR
jgi:hypothetical protein